MASKMKDTNGEENMFKMSHLAAFCILIGLIISISCSRQSSESVEEKSSLKQNIDVPKITADLKKNIPVLMKEIGVPGLSIALIHQGDIAWHSAFGITRIETKQHVNDDTVFEAASLSKPVFAYMILKLVSRGELALDRPLVEFAPEDYIRSKFLGIGFEDGRYKKINARIVLNHSTGFPNWRVGNRVEIYFEPGQKFGYSTEGFYYLQVIAERMMNQKLPELMKREVFEPLGMEKSSYLWKSEFENNSAYRHDMMSESKGLRRHTRALGPATLLTTARDYARFLIAMMNGEGLNQRTYQEMLSFQSTYSKEGYEGVDWGLGTGLERSDYGIGIWHWGDNTYAQAFYLAFPAQKMGIVYLANSFFGLALAKDIADIAFGGDNPVMSCGIMQPYLLASKPVSEFIQKIQNGEFEAAEDIFRKHIYDYIGNYNETLLNDIGSWLLKRECVDAAILVFGLNVEAYPDSWIVYDSLGDAHVKSHNKELAIRNYEKSLELNPDNTNATEMLDKLKKKQIRMLQIS